MRFDDEAYLKDWRLNHRFPVIHDHVFNVAANYVPGDKVLDLGCSTGLLATRLQQLGCKCIGVDSSPRAIELARQYQVPVTIHQLNIKDSSTIDELIDLVEREQVTAIVARRIMPELFGHNTELGHELACKLRHTRVSTVILQGRIVTVRATNQLRSLADEIKLFYGYYATAYNDRAVAVLRPI